MLYSPGAGEERKKGKKGIIMERPITKGDIFFKRLADDIKDFDMEACDKTLAEFHRLAKESNNFSEMVISIKNYLESSEDKVMPALMISREVISTLNKPDFVSEQADCSTCEHPCPDEVKKREENTHPPVEVEMLRIAREDAKNGDTDAQAYVKLYG